jgi:hypothetical protein
MLRFYLINTNIDKHNLESGLTKKLPAINKGWQF